MQTTRKVKAWLRRGALFCAATLGLGAYAATPIAVWDGNFSESATINGATFNANGNTVAEDGSYVKITGEKGAVFTLNKSYRYITAVFTVSNLNETAAYDRALAVVGGNTLFGAYLQSGTLTTHGINGNAIWPTSNASDYSSYDATLTSYADAETQRTFSLTQVHSTYSYSGTHLYEVYGGDTAAAIKFGGSSNNGLRGGQTYSKVVIGGMESYTEGTTLFKAASDLVILKVALYASDSTFPIAQADYATYSMPSMTVVTTPSTMSALNTAVAAASDAVALSDVSSTITLDEEPSDATKSILQSAYWQGTVLIKDADKNNIVPSNYGNPNSTLKLSGVKGYFAAQQFNSSATPAIELEDSETKGREYGLWQDNGYSFYSGASGTYQYMNTPELKGSGTYKIDTTETSSLFVADKFSSFTGKLEVTYGAVWLGVAVPSRDVTGREFVKVGTVRVSEAFVNAPLSQWTGWTVANGYLGDVTVAAGSTNNYTDNRVNFLKADSWKGTLTISAATNNTSGHVEIWLSKLGGANSTIVINDLVSGSKDYYLNEGNYQNNPTFVSTIDINGDVQFKNGSSSQTVTFDKVTSDSATDKLTLAFPTSATLNFKINSLDNFAGTISASSSTPLTISNITSTAALGTALVKVDATNKNIASLDATELNGTSTNLCVDTVNDVSGIYIAAAIIGSTGYATVQNAIDALGSDPTDAQLATVSVADANAAIPEGYKAENGVIARDIVYVAQILGGDSYTTLQAAVDAAVRNSKIIVLANETDGATIPSKDISFYIYTGEFETGEILDATGDYITTRTIEEISISDDYHADKVTATKYSVVAAFMAVTIDGTRTLYGQANANDALTAANAGAIGTKIEFLSGDPASYAEYLPMFDYDSETGVYTKVANPVVAVYSGVQQLSVHRTLAEAVAAAENGLTVKLLADVTLDSTVVVDNSLTFDLNGMTVTGPADGYVFSNAGSVVITGEGAVTSAGGIVTNTASGASVVISNGTYTVTGDLFGNVEGGEIAVSGGTFSAPLDDDYCAEGYEPADLGNGTYGVRIDKGWIYEDKDFPNYTGSWTTQVEYGADNKITLDSDNTYTANKPSDGRFVTLNVKASFDDVNDDNSEIAGAKAAVRLAAGDIEGSYVFQLYMATNNIPGCWVNVGASVEATTNTDYTFTLVLDMTNKTYTAQVDGEFLGLITDNAITNFYFATAAATDVVQTLDFRGSGTVTSITGSYENPEAPAQEFTENQEIGSVTLTARQATWLNGQNNYAALAAKIATMDATAFNNAYLLNLDILDEEYDGTCSFTVTEITFGPYEFEGDPDPVTVEAVTIKVELVRKGALDGGINGRLSLKGGNSLSASGFETISEVLINDETFKDGNVATIVFEKDDEHAAAFYQPVILPIVE